MTIPLEPAHIPTTTSSTKQLKGAIEIERNLEQNKSIVQSPLCLCSLILLPVCHFGRSYTSRAAPREAIIRQHHPLPKHTAQKSSRYTPYQAKQPHNHNEHAHPNSQAPSTTSPRRRPPLPPPPQIPPRQTPCRPHQSLLPRHPAPRRPHRSNSGLRRRRP